MNWPRLSDDGRQSFPVHVRMAVIKALYRTNGGVATLLKVKYKVTLSDETSWRGKAEMVTLGADQHFDVQSLPQLPQIYARHFTGMSLHSMCVILESVLIYYSLGFFSCFFPFLIGIDSNFLIGNGEALNTSHVGL